MRFSLLICLLVCLSAGCVYGPRNYDDPELPPPFNADGERDPQIDSLISGAVPAGTENYTIGPGDEISISLVGNPGILGSASGGARFSITENPFIVLPQVGSVSVHGKTVDQLEGELRTAFSETIRDPRPVVTIERFSSNQAVVLGSVKTPGRYPLDKNDTLLEIIFKAGGLTLGGETGSLPPANTLKLYRLRSYVPNAPDSDPMEQAASGQEQRVEIDIPLDDFILGGNLSYNISVLPNDIVYIPPAGTAVVHGHAKRPRVVFLGPGLRTLSQVLTETGGLRFRAASRVEIVRRSPDGDESFYVNARRIMKRRDQDFQLRDNDQIYIYSTSVRAFFDSLASIFSATASTGVNATYSPI